MHTALAYMPNVAQAYMPDAGPAHEDDDAPPTQRSTMDLRAYARTTEEATVIIPAAWLAQLRAEARGEVLAPKSARIIEVVELSDEDVIVESDGEHRDGARPSSRPASGIHATGVSSEPDEEIDVIVDEMFEALSA